MCCLPDDLPSRATGRRTILSQPRPPCLTQWRTSGGWCGSGGVIQSLCSPNSKRGSRYCTVLLQKYRLQSGAVHLKPSVFFRYVIVLYFSWQSVYVFNRFFIVFCGAHWKYRTKIGYKSVKCNLIVFPSDLSSTGKVFPVLAIRGQCNIWRLYCGADWRFAVWNLYSQRHGAHLQTSEYILLQH